MTYSYRLYGLTIGSNFPLPELELIDSHRGNIEHDGVIRVVTDKGEIGTIPPNLAWPEIGSFWIRNGREILVSPAPNAAAPAMRLVLLGQVFAAMLHQRGYLPLHASGVALPTGNGSVEAVGFLGYSRQGKSTMAAAFNTQGYQVVADDIIAISPASLAELAAKDGCLPLIAPGFPALKLWPEAISELYRVPETLQLPPFAAYSPRRIRDVRSTFSSAALPLRRLYLLEDGPVLASERLSRSVAIQQLLRHAYWTAFLNSGDKEQLLRQCIILTRSVPVYLLSRPHDLTQLPDVVRFIAAQMG